MARDSWVSITLPRDPVAQEDSARLDYVKQQGAPKFADAVSRELYFTTTALAPLKEGQLSYLEDIDELQVCTDVSNPAAPVWEVLGPYNLKSTVITVSDGLTGGGDLTVGPVHIATDLGAGLAFNAAAPYGGIYVNADDVTLTVNANDNLIIKDLGVSNRHLNATIGGLTNVTIATDTPVAPTAPNVGTPALVWDGTNWVSDPMVIVTSTPGPPPTAPVRDGQIWLVYE